MYTQCTVALPSSVAIQSTSGAIEHDFESWVCSGLTVTLSEEFKVLYVEANSNVTVDGNTNVIYMKGPGTLTIEGNDNMAVYSPNVTVVDKGKNTVTSACPPALKFTYDEAPAGGCEITSLPAHSLAGGLRVFPNPARDVVWIKNEGKQIIGTIQVFNAAGQLMLEGENTERIDVSAWVDGVYFVKITSVSGDAWMERIAIVNEQN
jgi:hypothetical protein